eukprot:1179477-Prorocentrum_minimum.AAC.1
MCHLIQGTKCISSPPCDWFPFRGDALFQTHENLEHLAMMEASESFIRGPPAPPPAVCGQSTADGQCCAIASPLERLRYSLCDSLAVLPRDADTWRPRTVSGGIRRGSGGESPAARNVPACGWAGGRKKSIPGRGVSKLGGLEGARNGCGGGFAWPCAGRHPIRWGPEGVRKGAARLLPGCSAACRTLGPIEMDRWKRKESVPPGTLLTYRNIGVGVLPLKPLTSKCEYFQTFVLRWLTIFWSLRGCCLSGSRHCHKYFRHAVRELNWPEGASSRESVRAVRKMFKLQVRYANTTASCVNTTGRREEAVRRACAPCARCSNCRRVSNPERLARPA